MTKLNFTIIELTLLDKIILNIIKFHFFIINFKNNIKICNNN